MDQAAACDWQLSFKFLHTPSCHANATLTLKPACRWLKDEGIPSDYLFQESWGFKRCCYQHRHYTVHVMCVQWNTGKYKPKHIIICPNMSFFKRNEEPQTTQSSSVGRSETWKHENVEKLRRNKWQEDNIVDLHAVSITLRIRPCISRCITGSSLGSRPKGASTRSSRAPCARIHTKLSLKHCQLQSIKHSFLKQRPCIQISWLLNVTLATRDSRGRHTSQCVILVHFVLSEIGPESRCNSNKTGY